MVEIFYVVQQMSLSNTLEGNLEKEEMEHTKDITLRSEGRARGNRGSGRG